MLLSGSRLVAQQAELYPYFPAQTLTDDWKVRAGAFIGEESNSNTFTNNFINEVTGSGYIGPELKEEQLDKMNGDILTGTLRSIGGGVYIRSKNLFYYAGIEHQQILDSRIGSELARLLMLGNKPFAGTTLEVPASDYTNVYFNRLVGGVGYTLQKESASHGFFALAGITSGQNYDQIHVDQASLYTHPDGDYLDLSVQANTQVSDTVWADVFDFNGFGLTFDLNYSLHKDNDYYAGITVKNIGFINWNGNTFTASVDTAFRFEGVSMDTTGTGGNVPDDYSYKNLRRILFKNPESAPFSKGTPIILNVTGGKYFADGKFYAGINAFIYPSLDANYKVELFGTWNHRSVFQLTPIVAFGAYQQVHFGLAAGLKLGKSFRVQAGSSYLDSFFIGNHPAGRGGFVRLVYIR
jgi:hypothetical protein